MQQGGQITRKACIAALLGCASTIIIIDPATALAHQPVSSPDLSASLKQNLPPMFSAATEVRDTGFTVPLVDQRRVLGDVLIQVSSSGSVAFETQSLRKELERLLSDLGRQRLDEILADRTYIRPDELKGAGFDLRFDQNRLEVVIEAIDGRYRPVGTIGDNSERTIDRLPTNAPAGFSAFLNLNGNFDYASDLGALNPEVYLFGAARIGNVVMELDGAVTDQLEDNYRFYRRSLRGIYDIPDKYIRFSAGDLRPETLPLLRTPLLGGVAIERRRQTFSAFSPVTRLGGREIFLDSRSTVDVIINGAKSETLNLDAGRYDLGRLPLQFGSNDVRLLIRDSAGREQSINFDYFFEPLDLEAGDYEFVFGAGFIARELSFEPNYSDDLAAIGYYRKAISNNLILGAGAQISGDIQVIALEASVVPQVIPGSFDLQAAASTGNGTGISLRGGYRLIGGNDVENRSQLSLTIDFESKSFRTVGDVFGNGFSILNINTSYSQAFSLKTFMTAGVTHTRRGGGLPDRTVAYVEAQHRLAERFRVTAGLEYGDDEVYDRSWGIRLGFSLLFGARHRANVDYRSRTETLRATVARGGDNYVGSWGYDLGFSDSRGDTSADASFDYTGNRFQARASINSNGQRLGSIADRQRARVQIGTSLAYADGTFGIGRPINDSFILASPHSSLKGKDVITARSLDTDKYYARSGLLGAAVQSDITSYSPQNVQYDVAGLETGYDIGDGVVRVDPPFHSGYKLVVGNDRFVSAIGSLTVNGKPAELLTGTVASVDDEGFETQAFFTNSVGRFGIIGLAPGKSYVVSVGKSGLLLTIKVPETNGGLLRLGTVDLSSEEK